MCLFLWGLLIYVADKTVYLKSNEFYWRKIVFLELLLWYSCLYKRGLSELLIFCCRNGDNGKNSGPSLSGGGVQGLGMGLPDLKSKKMGKQKVSKESQHVSEALDKLREQTRETVKGLESITAPMPEFGNDAMMEDWVKQFEELAGSQVLHLPWLEV